MTLITGHVADVGMNAATGTFQARASEIRGEGETVVTSAPASFPVTNGVVSAEVEPGPTLITLHVGPVRKDWFVNVPETDIGLGDLIATYMEYEPAVVSAAIKARDAAEAAKADAVQAALDAEAKRVAAETAATLTGQDRLHVDGVKALLDDTYDQSQAGMALPPRLMESELNATYVPKPAGVLDGQVPVWDAAAGEWVAGEGGGSADGVSSQQVRNFWVFPDGAAPGPAAPGDFRFYYEPSFSHFDTFASGIGGYTPRWDTAGTWTAPDVAGATGGKVAQATHTSGTRRLLTLNALDDKDTADIELVTRFRSPDPAAGSFSGGLAARCSGGAGAETGYAALITGARITLAAFNAGVYTALFSYNYTFLADTWTWIRFRLNGNRLQIRLWDDAAAEPSVWHVDRTDSTVTAGGWAGLAASLRTGAQQWDVLGVALEGSTAPKAAA